VTTATLTIRRTFASLSIRNFRWYFLGQAVSLPGTWMQAIGQSWLVLELTGSGTAVGLVTALQFLPMLFLAPWGGVIADRFDKRRLLFLTQSTAAILAAVLGIIVAIDVVELWMVYVLVGCLGLVASIDVPARQTFIMEMVGRDSVTNAVSLNSVLVNAARIVGPAIAGALIVTVGIGACFIVNALSYCGILVALVLIRPHELSRATPQPRRRGQLSEGIRYAAGEQAVLVPLLMMAVVGTFAYEYHVVLPLFARFTFDGDAGTFAAMTAAMGAGAVVGGLLTASRRSRTAISLAVVAIVFGSLQLVTAAAPTYALSLVALTLLGAASISFLALGNATLQLSAVPEMRGRVMGLWAVAFLGSTPIGGPIAGWIGEHIGPRFALGLGGLVTILAGVAAYRALSTIDRAGSEVGLTVPAAKLGP
jgi:MFS family permease